MIACSRSRAIQLSACAPVPAVAGGAFLLLWILFGGLLGSFN